MKKTYEIAAVNAGGNKQGMRIFFRLVRDAGRFRWYDESGAPTEVSDTTIARAIGAACAAWGEDKWGLVFGWDFRCPSSWGDVKERK